MATTSSKKISSGYKLFPDGKLSRVVFFESERIIGVDDVISAQSVFFTASLVFRRDYYEREYKFKKYSHLISKTTNSESTQDFQCTIPYA